MTVTLAVIGVTAALTLVSLALEAWIHTGDDAGDPVLSEQFLSGRLARRPRLAALLHRRIDPHAASGLLVTTALLVLFVTALVVGVLFDWVDGNDGLAELDWAIAQWGTNNATEASTDLLEILTQLGSTVVAGGALALAAAIDFVRHRNGHVLSFAALVVGGQWLLANGLKLAVGRERPALEPLVDTIGSSFPSGHSAAAAACWAGVALIASHRASRPVRLLAGAASVTVAVGVAASRSLLGVHWLTDIVAGVALGWGWCLFAVVVFSRRFRALAPLMARISARADRASLSTDSPVGARP